MQKLFFGLTFLIIFIVASVYTVLFTSFGNGLVASYLEKKVNKSDENVKFKVNKFVLTTKELDFYASLNDSSIIKINGNFSIFEKSIDLIYDIDIKDLSKFQSLIEQKLNGPFQTNGIVKGDSKLLVVDGKSNVASSDTKYDISLINFEPSTVKFKIKDAKIDKLLYLVNQPIVAKGDLSIDGNINNASVENLDGDVTLKVRNGKLNNKEFNKAYSQTIRSRIYFKSDVKAQLLSSSIKIKSNFISTLAEIYANETLINLKDNSINSDYKVAVKKLSLLQSIVGMKLNGDISTSGNIAIKGNDISVSGDSNLVSSKTTYKLKIEDAKAKSLKVDIKDAKLDHLLHMLNQPVYTRGNLNINADLKNLDLKNLDGAIKTTISDAKIINPVVNTIFELQLKDKITYNLDVNTKLLKTQIISDAILNSTLAKVTVNKALFNLNKMTFNSDYKVNADDLSKLYDLSQMKMRGKVEVLGDISSNSKDLVINGRSNLLDGTLKYKLKNDKLTAKLKDIEVLKAMEMLYYPEFFKSKGSFDLDYNLTQQKGVLTGKLINGTFIKNKFSSLLNQLARFDITKEVYDTTDINSSINQMVIKSTVNMKSNKSTIDVTQSTLDIPKNQIDALIDVKLKVLKTKIKVKGALDDPKVSLVSDKQKEIKKKLKKNLNKQKDKVKENLKKALKNEDNKEKAKELLKDFKSLF